VSIKAEGRLFVDAGNEEDVEVEFDELTARVTDALQKKPGLPVLIRGDKTVDYGKVVTVMASLKNAGVPSVGLMTGPTEDE
jgi:biopolymer transport protein TolR